MTRKERERHAHRREILLAARSIFARRGFSSATMDEVAAAAEFGKATIYCYFGSKEELYRAVIDEVLEELGEIVREAIKAEGTYAERIELLVRRTLHAALAAPESLCLIGRELHATVPRIDLEAETATVLKPLEGLLREEQRAGRLVRNLPAGALAKVLLTMVLGAFLGIIHGEIGTLVGCGQEDRERSRALDDRSFEKAVEDAVATVSLVFLHGATVRGSEQGNAARPRRKAALQ